ncbi:MAG: thioesterase family protein [Gallionella sp.]
MQTSNSATHIFDTAIALTPHDDDNYNGQTSPAYGNMVGPFGGIIGATLLNAMMCHPARLGDPLSLTVHYAAPIADGAFSVHARAVRTNRSTQHWIIELIQADQVAAFATVTSAIRRDSWNATDAIFPSVPSADSLTRAPAIERAAWTARYDMRFIDGSMGTPNTSSHPSQSRLWVRDEPARPLDFLSLAAICDAFVPRIFVRQSRWMPASTVALTTYFHADAAQLSAQDCAPVLGIARALHFGHGFSDQSAEIWSTDGVLLAVSHQIVYFKG